MKVSKTGDARVGLIGFPSVQSSAVVWLLLKRFDRFIVVLLTFQRAISSVEVGKSTLLNKMTGSASEAKSGMFELRACGLASATYEKNRKQTALQVASYEFTTLTCVPGVFNYKAATSSGETHALHAQNIPVSWNQIIGRAFLSTALPRCLVWTKAQ